MGLPEATVIESRQTDPFFNLALEEWLVRTHSPGRRQVLIYRNRPSVILGRNQNPWRECAVNDLPAMGVTLARRVSGGGTVYHDLGNTNVTVILPRQEYDVGLYLDHTVRALARLGACVMATDRHDLVIDSCKVAGSAFMLTSRAALQHWTMLIRADLARVHDALVPARPGLVTKAVASRPSPTTNIACHAPAATHEQYVAALLGILTEAEVIDGEPVVASVDQKLAAHEPRFRELLGRHRHADWVLGRTPPFTERLETCSPLPKAVVTIAVKQGKIEALEIDANLVPRAVAVAVAQAACGCYYGSPELAAALQADATHHPGVAPALTAVRQMLYLPLAEL